MLSNLGDVLAHLPAAHVARLPALLAAHLLAFVDLQTAMSQGQNTMAVKDGSGPRPAVQSAKRCFLNCLETSFKLQTFHLLAYLPARQLLLSSFLAPGWWQCLLWRAAPCHRRVGGYVFGDASWYIYIYIYGRGVLWAPKCLHFWHFISAKDTKPGSFQNQTLLLL